MPSFPLQSTRTKQQGAVLLLLALIILVTGTSFALSSLKTRNILITYMEHGNKDLRQAHAALLGYAMSYSDLNAGQLPGYLPCPDVDGDGLEDRDHCSPLGQSVIGWLPWRTLGLPSLRNRESCLWYAVSGSYKASLPAHTTAINPDTNGLFQIEDMRGTLITGAAENNRAIAIIFSAGKALNIPSNKDLGTFRYTQYRANTSSSNKTRTTCGSTSFNARINKAQEYLESIKQINNATGTKSGVLNGFPGQKSLPTKEVSVFIQASQQEIDNNIVFNDILKIITTNDMKKVSKRREKWVMDLVRQCIVDHGKPYPQPSALSTSHVHNYAQITPLRFGRILEHNSSNPTTPNWPKDIYGKQCFSWSWWASWREQIFYGYSTATADLKVDGKLSTFVLALSNRPTTSATGNKQLRGKPPQGYHGQPSQYFEGSNIGAAQNIISGANATFINQIAGANDHFCNASECNF